MSEETHSLWLVGPGRAGLSLVLMLHRAGAIRSLTVTGRTDDPARVRLLRDRGMRPTFTTRLDPPALPPDGVVIAVHDGAIGAVAERLAGTDMPPEVPILHLSGATPREALAPLARRGHPTGVLHPLCPLPDPVDGAVRLRGAWFGVEGEGAAADLADWVVRVARGRALRFDPAERVRYHTAAVFASNALVALLSIATRTMEAAGASPEDAAAAVSSLAGATVEDVRARGLAGALTGPVARGDVETVRQHLARLSTDDRRLYCLLGEEILRLAGDRLPSPEVARQVARALTPDP